MFQEKSSGQCGLRICILSRKISRIRDVRKRLELIQHVGVAPSAVEMLISTQDFVSALDLLEQSLNLCIGEDGLLKGLTCVKQTTKHLQKLLIKYDETLEKELISKSGALIFGNAPKTEGNVHHVSFENIIQCLLRRNSLKNTISKNLRDVLLAHSKKYVVIRIREAIKHSLQTIKSDGSVNANGPTPGEDNEQSDVADTIRTLNYPQFLQFWESMMTGVCLNLASRLEQWSRGLIRIAEDIGQVEDDLFTELGRVVDVLLTVCIQKMSKILSARQQAHVTLSTDEWNRILQRTSERLDRIRVVQQRIHQLHPHPVSGSTDVCTAMRTVLSVQTKHIVEEFHLARVGEVHLFLGEEKWDAILVKLENLQALSTILECTPPTPRVEDYEVKSLQVDDKQYFVVASSLHMVRILKDYIEFVRGLPQMAMEVMQRLNNLLKMFNKQVFSLILGGGAAHQGILKKITAMNLSLCSQTCSFLSVLIPKVKSQVTRLYQEYLNKDEHHNRGNNASINKGSMNDRFISTIGVDIDATTNDFKEHNRLLHVKLATILSERYDFHAKKWFTTPHPAAPSTKSLLDDGTFTRCKGHDHLEPFLKDLCNMHKALFKNLSVESVQQVFTIAFKEVTEKFGVHCEELSRGQDDDVYTNNYPIGDRYLQDLVILFERLRVLDGLENVSYTSVQNLVALIEYHLPDRYNPAVLQSMRNTGACPKEGSIPNQQTAIEEDNKDPPTPLFLEEKEENITTVADIPPIPQSAQRRYSGQSFQSNPDDWSELPLSQAVPEGEPHPHDPVLSSHPSERPDEVDDAHRSDAQLVPPVSYVSGETPEFSDDIEGSPMLTTPEIVSGLQTPMDVESVDELSDRKS